MAVILHEDFETAGLLAGQSPGAGMTWTNTFDSAADSEDVVVAGGRIGGASGIEAGVATFPAPVAGPGFVLTCVVRGLPSIPSDGEISFRICEAGWSNAASVSFSFGSWGVQVYASTGGGVNEYSIDLSPSVYPSSTVDVELKWVYDGAYVRFYVDGVETGVLPGVSGVADPFGAFSLFVNGLWLYDLLLETSEAVGPEPVEGICSAPSMLDAAGAVGSVPVAGVCSVPSMLGTASAVGFHDFTVGLGDVVTRYVLDLVTPAGLVRVPMSSWQATLQTGRSNYVQAVVPAVGDWVDSINAATEFVVSRVAVLPGGGLLEYEMVRGPVEQASFSRGPSRFTCTLSGYSTGFAVDEDPPAVYDRELAGVRSISSGTGGMRVRSSIDWLLRPGHRAFADGSPFVVAYINYYVAVQDGGSGDAYMDAGERN